MMDLRSDQIEDYPDPYDESEVEEEEEFDPTMDEDDETAA